MENLRSSGTLNYNSSTLRSVKSSSNQQLRLRVFAGPNGSGKSTIIREVQGTVQNGRPIDFGYYINADDITQSLRSKGFSLSSFHLKANKERLIAFAANSGLLDNRFSLDDLRRVIDVKGNSIRVTDRNQVERVGQIIARFLREEMLRLRRRFSFETVFSHVSNLEIMERAVGAGYKVYLYFVSTESPKINIFRVSLRVKNDGHDVPEDKIKSRYYRSLDLMYQAAQLAYQAFFFDNSGSNAPFQLVAHFKVKGVEKLWDKIDKRKMTNWFRKYYIQKAAEG